LGTFTFRGNAGRRACCYRTAIRESFSHRRQSRDLVYQATRGGVYSIPSGSVIPMHFPDSLEGSSVPFSIHPDEVDIAPIPTGSGEGLVVRLIRPARGTLSIDGEGQYIISFVADISVSLVHPTLGGSKRLRLSFTTESVQASSADGKTQLAVSGMRGDPSARALQLVTATRNAQDDFPGPGAAVYAVVSGSLDRLP
jgi:hypothetical protein